MADFGRLYAVTFVNVTVSAQQDLFYIKPAADKLCIVEKVSIYVVGGNADAGDAQEELLDVELLYVPSTVTASSGGSAPTPRTLGKNDAAAGFTARTNDTTKATSSGTIVAVEAGGMNSRTEFLYLPTLPHQPPVVNADAIVCRLNTTPADALAMNGTMLVRELP